MNDKDLRQDVLDELDFDPRLEAAHIGVTAEHGVITLTGHVGSYTEKEAAERAAQRVRGVRAIAQEIEVRYAEDKKTADDQIAERAVAIIAWSAQVPKDSIMVRVKEGWVTLTGTVPWHYQRLAAKSAVRKLSGVVGISNLVEVEPRVQATEVKTRIFQALKRSAAVEADAIRVDVKGNKVILEGHVKAWHERGIAERAAWSAPGVRAVEDHLTIP